MTAIACTHVVVAVKKIELISCTSCVIHQYWQVRHISCTSRYHDIALSCCEWYHSYSVNKNQTIKLE